MVIQLVRDPICGMDIDPTTAAGKSDYKDETYYFCAAGCKVDFDKDPEKYLDPAFVPEPMTLPKKPWWQFWR